MSFVTKLNYRENLKKKNLASGHELWNINKPDTPWNRKPEYVSQLFGNKNKENKK